MRIFFSTRSASGLIGDVHSPGSRVKPYFANNARALSSWIEPYAAAVIATLELAGLAVFSSAVCRVGAGAGGAAFGCSSIAVSAMGGGLDSG